MGSVRIAALYDIHGNLPALEAVLRDVETSGVDRIVVGGDVLPGPMPAECLARLMNLDVPVQFILGNGDREAIAQQRLIACIRAHCAGVFARHQSLSFFAATSNSGVGAN